MSVSVSPPTPPSIPLPLKSINIEDLKNYCQTPLCWWFLIALEIRFVKSFIFVFIFVISLFKVAPKDSTEVLSGVPKAEKAVKSTSVYSEFSLEKLLRFFVCF